MQPQQLRRILANRELPKTDFKAQLITSTADEKAAFVQDAIALTNTPGGNGRMVIGVDDATRKPIPGYRCESLEDLDRVVEQYVHPMIEMSLDRVPLDGVDVTVLTFIRDRQQLPYHVKKATGRLQVYDWWMRHGRLNARPTVEEQRAVFEESRRARLGRAPAVRLDEDQYSALSARERLQRMSDDLRSVLKHLSLQSVLDKLDHNPHHARLDLMGALPFIRDWGAAVVVPVVGYGLLLVITVHNESPSRKEVESWVHRGPLLDLHLGADGGLVLPFRLDLAYGPVREAPFKNLASFFGGFMRTKLDCGYYTGPSFESLAQPTTIAPYDEDVPQEQRHREFEQFIEGQWADRAAEGYLGYAPTIYVGTVRSRAAMLEAIRGVLAWADGLPLAEFHSRVVEQDRRAAAERGRR